MINIISLCSLNFKTDFKQLLYYKQESFAENTWKFTRLNWKLISSNLILISFPSERTIKLWPYRTIHIFLPTLPYVLNSDPVYATVISYNMDTPLRHSILTVKKWSFKIKFCFFSLNSVFCISCWSGVARIKLPKI